MNRVYILVLLASVAFSTALPAQSLERAGHSTGWASARHQAAQQRAMLSAKRRTNPSFPDTFGCQLVGSWQFGPSLAVAVDSARGLTFCGAGCGVYLLDVSNPGQPVELSEAIRSRSAVLGVFFAGDRLYVAGDSALEIWDVSTPRNPQLLG